MEKTFTAADLKPENLKNLTLVDFWATWCGPCKMIAPAVSAIAEKYDGRLTVGKVDIDQEMTTATSFDVMAVPTLILFKDGEEVERIVGYQSEAQLAEAVEKHL